MIVQQVSAIPLLLEIRECENIFTSLNVASISNDCFISENQRKLKKFLLQYH